MGLRDVQSQDIRGKTSEAVHDLVIDWKDLWEFGGHGQGLDPESFVRGDGDAVFALHGDQSASVVFHNRLESLMMAYCRRVKEGERSIEVVEEDDKNRQASRSSQ